MATSQNGQITLTEYCRIDYNGAHTPDTAAGGTNDFIIVSGNESNGITTIEFKRKLNTGDKLDTVLVKGNNNVVWAYGPDDALSSEHSSLGVGTITIIEFYQ